MNGQITDLDDRRGMAAQKATELRRLRIEVETDQAALRAPPGAREVPPGRAGHLLVGGGGKARYLIDLFATTPEAQDPRRQRLIQALYDDFDRLQRPQDPAVPGQAQADTAE